MIAYNKTLIRNLALVKRAKQWYSQQLISTEQMGTILKNYDVAFYNPNLFVKIGLFIFTWIAIGAALGFYSTFIFIIVKQFDKGFGAFTCFLYAALCFFILELVIKKKKIYRSGIDECLLYSGLGFLIGAFGFAFMGLLDEQNHFLLLNILALPFMIAAVVRYADRLVSLVLVLSVYTIFFLLLLKIGPIAKLIMPFALMLISVPLYFAAKKHKLRPELFYWKNCILALECVALLIFYLTGNYYVIRESSIAFFDLNLNPGEHIPLAFLFYLLTALVPLLYVYYGLKKKDKVLLWIGLMLIAASGLTFKYYFSLGHPEITMMIAGTLLIALSYASIRYLKTPQHGLTFIEEPDEDNFLKSHAEALLVAQTFSQQGSPSPGSTEFGGGSFGGAGSGDTY